MTLPIFTDEAIYTRWSQIARYDANWRFISLTDGKQPTFVWIDMVIMRFIHDPLLAGRLVSTFAGFMTMGGLFFLGREFFKSKESIEKGIFSFTKKATFIGVIAALVYIIYPFSLVYDRMALYDSLVAMISVWALYLEILLVRYRRLDIALILGMVIGVGVLTKTSAFFFIYLLPFSLLLFNLREKHLIRELSKWIGLAGISIIIAYAMYSIQRLSPFFNIIDEKNAVFVYPMKEWLEHPFRFIEGNLRGMFDWLIHYFTLPVFIFLFGYLFVDFKHKLREKLLILVWFAAPFFALALFARLLYPRFILFMTMPLLALLAYSIEDVLGRFRSNALKAAFIIVLISLVLRSDFLILTNFANSPIPKLDSEQYINGWPSGGGIKEIIAYLDQQSKKGKIFVLSTGTFGSLPTYSVEIYLGDNKNIEKQGIYPIPAEIPKDILQKAKSMPVYLFMSNQGEFYEYTKFWQKELILEYKKGNGSGNAYSRLYKVVPK